ncbi:hypothetical protein AV521_28240 [Streptomyces sp. IMTB 2501]|nr:hypothetical protein AV521_28240 [Streptomyces sp. IMTB 2501]
MNTVRRLGYGHGVAVFGAVLTSRMTGTLPGGGAGALRGGFPDHTLHTAFTSGLNGALVMLGLLLVRVGRRTPAKVPRAEVEQAVPARRWPRRPCASPGRAVPYMRRSGRCAP